MSFAESKIAASKFLRKSFSRMHSTDVHEAVYPSVSTRFDDGRHDAMSSIRFVVAVLLIALVAYAPLPGAAGLQIRRDTSLAPFQTADLAQSTGSRHGYVTVDAPLKTRACRRASAAAGLLA